MEPAFALAFAANFGSVETWREEFAQHARSLAGDGRVALVFQPQTGALAHRLLPDASDELSEDIALLTKIFEFGHLIFPKAH